MFQVAIRIEDEERFTEEINTMRTWIDHMRFEPLTLRYTFQAPVIMIKIDFTAHSEARAFASAFGGEIV